MAETIVYGNDIKRFIHVEKGKLYLINPAKAVINTVNGYLNGCRINKQIHNELMETVPVGVGPILLTAEEEDELTIKVSEVLNLCNKCWGDSDKSLARLTAEFGAEIIKRRNKPVYHQWFGWGIQA